MSDVRRGLAQARVHWRLALLVWALFLVLAAMAALPAWRWLDQLLGVAPEGDRLLEGLNLALLRELFQYDRSLTPAIALGSIWTLAIVALLVNPFVAGGTLGVLLSHAPLEARGDPTRAPGLTRQFVAHGMQFYWRFSRVLIVTGAIALLVGVSLVTLLSGLAEELRARGLERPTLWVRDLRILVALVVILLTSLIVDLARIRIVREDDPRAWQPVREAIAFLRHRARACLGVTVAFLALMAAAALIYALVASLVTPRSWVAIVLAIAWQQAFAWTRTWLRVGMLAGLGSVVTLARDPRPV